MSAFKGQSERSRRFVAVVVLIQRGPSKSSKCGLGQFLHPDRLHGASTLRLQKRYDSCGGHSF
jgi:hypothetical protein